MRQSALKKFIPTYYFYRLVYVVTAFGLWSYMHLLVMRNFDSLYDAVPVVFINMGTYHIGLMLGYCVSMFSLTRLGYTRNFRLAYLVLMLAGTIGFINVGNILEVYSLISIIHGVGAGLYWHSLNVFHLKDLHGINRGRTMSIALGWEDLIAIILPVVAGFVVTEFSYQYIFAAAIVLYVIGVLLPQPSNPKLENHIDLSEFKRIVRLRGFKQFEILTFVGGLLEDQRTLVMTILPFLLIGQELEVGLFTSFMGLVGVIIVFAQRNQPMKHKLKYGNLASAIVAISTTVFIYFWSVPALTIRNIVAKVGFALWTPVKVDADNRVQELVLKDFLQESAMELSFLREVALFASRFLNLLFFAAVFYVLKLDTELVLKSVLFVSALREFVMLTGSRYLLDKLKIQGTRKSQANEKMRDESPHLPQPDLHRAIHSSALLHRLH